MKRRGRWRRAGTPPLRAEWRRPTLDGGATPPREAWCAARSLAGRGPRRRRSSSVAPARLLDASRRALSSKARCRRTGRDVRTAESSYSAAANERVTRAPERGCNSTRPRGRLDRRHPPIAPHFLPFPRSPDPAPAVLLLPIAWRNFRQAVESFFRSSNKTRTFLGCYEKPTRLDLPPWAIPRSLTTMSPSASASPTFRIRRSRRWPAPCAPGRTAARHADRSSGLRHRRVKQVNDACDG